ncbi:TetR/AcrR family transcriptional regulator [Mycolicibacterium brisbanense]|uniref:TetR family transcriptional regulator n=1 Tax=Mycolicibacterium brisbanense TaxID=146020 RepID=A0A124DZI5_9MYCO|nr:TetR/AcrR family transcriptional regulator [Mycolicibacterium brisbanense]MCV7161546.1 TetR/AcrR family transcriptional regulator [Mycolicibacterium brisbanense]GAS87480.1 TetR family transcriptional regulator [Mycolicibacterium brisbanense]
MSTADEILGCAKTLIVTGGYNGFSYADIAREVGIRKASIHHHFPTKADLVRTLVSGYRQEALAGLAEIERHVGDPVGMLRSYADYWQACIMDATNPFCVCALLAAELPCLPREVADEVTAHFRALSTWITSILERGAKQNLFRIEKSPSADAEAFIATVHGAMLSARAYGDPKMFATVVTPLLDRLDFRVARPSTAAARGKS